MTITDTSGRLVAATAAPSSIASHVRRFPFVFYDARLTEVIDDAPELQFWTAMAQPRPGAGDSGAGSGQQLFTLMALAALVSVVALAVVARAMQVRVQVAAMKADFVSTVTHELKTPLSLMRLVADSLVARRYPDPEQISKYGEMLSAEVSRMTHLIDNLLSYARLSSVLEGHVAAPIDVAEFLAGVSEDWRPRLAQLGFAMDVEIDTEPMVLSGDCTALQQALNNLIDNSTKYTRPGAERRIAVRACRRERWIAIEVEDYGNGIHPDDLPLVREKFYRGRGTRASGSGLGLAIVNRVVMNHGGAIRIDSREGGGTAVTISLPEA